MFLFTLLARPIHLTGDLRAGRPPDQPVRVRGPVDLEALGGQIEWLRPLSRS
jgi:hypothetical protein